jgi:hypothetical protein
MHVGEVPPKVQLKAWASPPESMLAPATNVVAAKATLGKDLETRFPIRVALDIKKFMVLDKGWVSGSWQSQLTKP